MYMLNINIDYMYCVLTSTAIRFQCSKAHQTIIINANQETGTGKGCDQQVETADDLDWRSIILTKGSFYIEQYPVRWTAQSASHFLPSLADLFIPTPTRLLREAF